jgi:hypothetical protein
MPWTILDVERHKQGLTEKQKRQWVEVANSVLERCLKNGGSQKECEASAIRQANGVVNNYFVFNNKETFYYDVKRRKHNGKDHLIVPVVMMVEGVHNGSAGPLFHAIDELGKYPDVWNGIPVVIDHPADEGMNISANRPDVIDSVAVGRIYNTSVEGKKLKGEAWLEEEKLAEVAPEILQKVESREPIEVSVGIFSDIEENEGIFNNKKYIGIAKNIRPDHLAILTEMVGACSIADGCGLNVNKEKEVDMDVMERVTAMEQKRKELGMSVAEFYAIPRDPPSESKLPIFDEAHVRNAMARFNQIEGVSAEEKAKAKRKIIAKAKKFGIDTEGFEEATKNYSLEDNYKELTLFDDITLKINNDDLIKLLTKERKMSTNARDGCKTCLEKVNALIANKESGFTEEDRPWLETLPESALDKVTPKVIEKVVEKEKVIEVNKLTPEDKAALEFGKRQLKERREKWINAILTNSGKDVWKEEDLSKMDDTILERIYLTVNKKAEEIVDYSVMGFSKSDANKIQPLYPTGIKFENKTN